MPPNSRHVTFFCLLFVQVAACYALPITSEISVPFSLLTRQASPQPASRSLQKQTVELGGNKYTAVPLNEQGHYSYSYKLEPAFKYQGREVPAILKQVSDPISEEDELHSKTYWEIGFLKRKSVDLYLLHKWSSSKDKDGLYDVDIVVKDLGEADPPFKPIHIWYKEDPSITADDALDHARANTKNLLLWYANEEELLYRDYTMRNIFFRKTALLETAEAKREGIGMEGIVMPVDWGPEEKYTGVIDVANATNSAMYIQDYSEDLHPNLKDQFTVEKLAYQLWANGDDLRRQDYFWMTHYDEENSQSVYCRHLQIKITEQDEDGNVAYIYKVVDGVVRDGDKKAIKKYHGFLGKSALLTISTIGPESDEEITSLRENGLLLYVEDDEDENKVYIVYRDTRRNRDKPKKMKEWVEWKSVEYAGGSNADETVQT